MFIESSKYKERCDFEYTIQRTSFHVKFQQKLAGEVFHPPHCKEKLVKWSKKILSIEQKRENQSIKILQPIDDD